MCGCTIKTVSAAIKRLVSTDYLEVENCLKGKKYTFKKYKDFEAFSLDFLDNENLSFTEKAYLVAQQYLIKEDNTTYSSYEMGEKINMSPTTIRRCDKSLQAKEYLTIVPTKVKDNTGCLKQEKIFNLAQFGQAVVCVLKNHEDSIQDLKKEIESLRKTQAILLRKLSSQIKEPELILD